jgi:uncharacterized protein (DUF486 family)
MVLLQTIGLLALSNVFMTLAWYWHLKGLNDKPWYLAALVSWGIALAEYLLQVPANRLGNTQFTISQLKILQEVIALSVFVPVAVLLLREPVKWDYLWAALCVMAAVFFVFRGKGDALPAQAAQIVPANSAGQLPQAVAPTDRR